jgi:hypothetical protein
MTYAISYVTIKNLGPGDMTSVSDFRFMLRDGNGALRSPSYVSSASDCRLASVQLPPGGSVSGCVGFETPAAGSLELIYKAFTFGDLEPGNHLVFSIRP